MKRLNGKRMILWILAVILCVTACGPAFASTGDRTLFYADNESMLYLQEVVQTGDSFCVITGESMDTVVNRYTDPAAEPEKFVLEYEEPDYSKFFAMNAGTEEQQAPEAEAAAAEKKEEEDEEEDEDPDEGFLFIDNSKAGNDGEEEHQEETGTQYGSGYTWFGWNGELYALEPQQVSDGEKSLVKNIEVKHAKLEDGKVVMEDTEIPALSPDGLVEGDDYQYFPGVQRLFTAGDRLVILPYNYGMGGRKLIFCDLKDGSMIRMEVDDSTDVIPGPDGSLLMGHLDYSGDGMSCLFKLLNPETQEEAEEDFAKIENLKGYELCVCYDKEKNTLYYVDSGELWAKTLADPEKPAEAVNDCTDCRSMMLLKDGFVLVSGYRAALVKNTDPTQRQGITLRVFSTGYSTGVSDAIFEMNNNRGDVSAILQQDWRSNEDLLQAMLNHDAQNDVYVLSYSSSEFKALRDRGYLLDMSDDQQIAEATDRLFPFVQNAVKKNGKIIAVPVSMSGDAFAIPRYVFNELKMTEEELPKTWDQFLDWLPTLPARLEGTDYRLVSDYMGGSQLRMQLIQSILNQYQVMMDSKGEICDFNTPMLKDLLKRVTDLDTEALGLKEEINFEEMDENYVYHESLLNLYGISGVNDYSYSVILPLGFDEESRMMPVNLEVAFINPYTEHPEEAKEYLRTVLQKLDSGTQYSFFTDKTEPVPSPYAEENIKYQNQYVEELKKQLEKAEGEVKAELEENLREAEKSWEENKEEIMWSITPRMIEGYRKDLPLYMIQDYSLFNDLYSSEDDKEARKIMNGLFRFRGEGEEEVSIEEALSLLDKKIQMKRKEGN